MVERFFHHRSSLFKKGALNRCLNFPKMAEKSGLNQQNLPVGKTVLNKKERIGIADS